MGKHSSIGGNAAPLTMVLRAWKLFLAAQPFAVDTA